MSQDKKGSGSSRDRRDEVESDDHDDDDDEEMPSMTTADKVMLDKIEDITIELTVVRSISEASCSSVSSQSVSIQSLTRQLSSTNQVLTEMIIEHGVDMDRINQELQALRGSCLYFFEALVFLFVWPSTK